MLGVDGDISSVTFHIRKAFLAIMESITRKLRVELLFLAQRILQFPRLNQLFILRIHSKNRVILNLSLIIQKNLVFLQFFRIILLNNVHTPYSRTDISFVILKNVVPSINRNRLFFININQE